MDFEISLQADALRERLLRFMDEHVYPAEADYEEQIASASDPHAEPPVIAELRQRARSEGLWNLFLRPGLLPDDDPHARFALSTLDYAPLAEITGRSAIAPAALNCSHPDSGNMELLSLFASESQREQWLRPLLEGEIHSCFAMTEPDVASSDATNIECRIDADGDTYVINGRKWWITGALNPTCRLALVLGKTDSSAPAHRQQSLVLVPMDTEGLTVVRDLSVFGYHDPEGHAELVLEDVRVPRTNLLGKEGDAFAMAQARLGAGRVHHCMRAIGAAERAFELMCRRAHRRVAFGRPLAEEGVVREWVADSRIDIEQARLLTLKAAWSMDARGDKASRDLIAAIKIAVPQAVSRVIDRAIQVHGGAGLSEDLPLARMYAWQRALRILDGPDEVHRRTLGRRELGRFG
jgi:acyl-CoA dehydrogenase